MKQNAHTSKSTNFSIKYIGLFLVLVGFLALVSLIVQAAQLYGERYFVTKSFRVLVMDSSSSVMIIGVSKNNHAEMSLLTIHNMPSDFSQKSLFAKSISLSVPIDGVVVSRHDLVGSDTDVFTFGHVLSSVAPNAEKYMNINVIDKLLIWNVIRRTNELTQQSYEIQYDDIGEVNVVKIMKELFTDGEVISSKGSIEVLNTTEVSGLAGKTAAMLETLGYDVVSVRSQEASHTRLLVNDEKFINPTLERIFSVKTEIIPAKMISNSKVILGEDLVGEEN